MGLSSVNVLELSLESSLACTGSRTGRVRTPEQAPERSSSRIALRSFECSRRASHRMVR